MDVASLPRRRLTGAFWHQGPTGYELTSYADPARSEGRYHQLGGPGVWYASDQEQAAWAELMRHFLDEGVDPFEIRRRVGRVQVSDLAVLDLTNTQVRDAAGLTEADLLGDDYTATQAVAAAALAAGFDGLLAPSAALPGRRTLVVFAVAMPKVSAGLSRVRQPPPRMADLLRLIRPHRDTPASVRDYLRALAWAGNDAIRRLRRP